MRTSWIGVVFAAGCTFGVSPVDVPPPGDPVGSGPTMPGPATARPGAAPGFGGVVDPNHLGPGGDAVVTGSAGGLNLRSGPSTVNPVVVILPEGAWLHLDGLPQNDYWPVTWRAQSGWAYGAYLRAAPALPATLMQAVDLLAEELPSRTPGTELGLAVRELTSGEAAQLNESVQHVSASSAKAIWVAAALEGASVSAVTPYAQPIFANSDNAAAGSAIDLIGPNAVNDFYVNAGLSSSAFTQWSYGKTRVATNSPRAMGDDNYFTAADVVHFLGALDAGTLLGSQETQSLSTWMTWSPRTGSGGWMGTLLPAAARTTMRHKAGWLPPGCCSNDAVYNTLNDIGIVELPNGHHLAIAILARRGTDYWNKQAPFVEHAACVLYRAAAQDPTLTCN